MNQLRKFKGMMSRPRTLVVTFELPYPALCGRDLRNWQNIRGLAQYNEVGVFAVRPNNHDREKFPPLNLAFWRASNDRTFTAQPPRAKLEARAWPLNPLGHPADAHYTDSVATEIAEVLTSFKPECVIVEGLMLYRYIELLRRYHCRVVIDCHNVEAILYEQIGSTVQGDELPQRLSRNLLPARTKTIEEIAVQSADQVWVCSEEDKRIMRHLYPEAKPIYVVPNTVDVTDYQATRACRTSNEAKAKYKQLIFPAIFGYPPNAIAASFLITEIFPRLSRSYDGCELILAGGRSTSEMVQAAQQESRIVVTGGVPDIRPYLAAASAMIVPLFQGSGTRFKILEALASKLPVISTAKGAEGLAVENEKHLLLAETADEFVSAVIRLWSDDSFAKQLSENGFELVHENYSHDVAAQRIAAAISYLDCPP